MPRPPHADAAATRQRILERASVLFAEKGVAGCSTREIGAAAGVTAAMVHHYFGSKEGLYDACVEAMYAELAQLQGPLQEALSRGGDLPALIDRAVRAGFRFALEHRLPLRLLQRQILESGALDAERRQLYQRPFLDAASAAFGRATGRPARDWRLPLQSAVMLVVRYAVSDLEELTFFADTPPDAAALAVEDHLVAAVQRLLEPR